MKRWKSATEQEGPVTTQPSFVHAASKELDRMEAKFLIMANTSPAIRTAPQYKKKTLACI
jgi:hypothetical protein